MTMAAAPHSGAATTNRLLAGTGPAHIDLAPQTEPRRSGGRLEPGRFTVANGSAATNGGPLRQMLPM